MEETIPRTFFGFTHESPGLLPALVAKDQHRVATLSRACLEENVRRFAVGLALLGIMPGERVAILAENSPAWIVADLGLSSAGAVGVPVYPTLATAEASFILNDCQATALIFSPTQLKKALCIKQESSSLRHLISTTHVGVKGIRSIEEVSSLAETLFADSLFKERLNSRLGQDPFSVIYTSGTTGRPKGVVLTHRNILSNIEAVLKVVDITSKDRYLSYLPLSHIFERMVHHLFLYRGATIAYSAGFAYVGADVLFFKPTIMTGVPFFFERLKRRIIEGVEKRGVVKKQIFHLAMRVCEEHGECVCLKRGFVARFLDRLVLKGVREMVAPGLRFFISGGAKLPVETARFFWSLGMPVIEGYGLTETSPVVTVNTPEAAKLGTVGRAIRGIEISIADDGEILVKGPNVMQGYLNLPEENKKVFSDGWFRTGDIGSLDDRGYLTITDRKKDIIITSLGKNVSSQRIEMLLKSDECIKEALVYGNGRPHLVALIFPDREALSRTGISIEDKIGLHVFFEKRMRDRLKDVARFESIRRFSVIEDDLTIEKGELTPTMKVKRERVGERYKDIIEGLYDNET
ncbi:MAG: long-chain fatty acid--CoA ligase [Deltaproteobacteria bacterium]|nr:long-chain fatty acid--CoA ligase [Deltaproteobacteria bacterium]